MIDGKRILITGGTGSLGRALVERLLSGKHGNPESITIFSRGEEKQHEMRLAYPSDKLNFIIGDVRDYHAILVAVVNADILIHTAALKHVSACEANPIEARQTNIGGAENIVRAVKEGGARLEVVVGVSTDKACQPVNVYGATKFMQERILIWANRNLNNTRFICVRYGNVIGSTGSVIPIFKKQIWNGGPIRITNPDMTRFLVTFDLAVDTLIEAIETALPGEVYIPSKLPATTIGDIANTLIDYRDIKIVNIGIQPGEKMHEILISNDEMKRTLLRDGYYVITQEKQADSALSSEYNSQDNLISRSKLSELFRKEGLI